MRFQMRALAVVLVVALGGCNFATKHPSVTASIVVGSLGLMTCSLTTPIDGDPSTPNIDDVGSSSRVKCYGVTGGIAVGLGLLTRLALWLGTEDETTPAAGDGDTVGDPGNLEPVPVFVPKRMPKPPPPPPPPTPEPTPDPTPEPTPNP
jgi:hypothetical protein